MAPLIAPLVNLVGGWMKGRQETKKVEAEATAQWEKSVGRSMENGWKDEYVTVIITMPLLNIFFGNLYSVFDAEKGQAILSANNAAMAEIGQLMDTPYGQVMMVVVLAAVGIKTVKALK